ncbi:hypothetical protein QE400_000046 [Xanthomonas sacchari]|uniref:hypothetical protein n=1 Tax=Xanthomonas sacchari TaxID=56458 RepID=UPI002784AE59|nr:hypothetical protein [Xanthomonas sacchari]MDQ1090633.1 hypothetical protein [Xanthomonas sacchari]
MSNRYSHSAYQRYLREFASSCDGTEPNDFLPDSYEEWAEKERKMNQIEDEVLAQDAPDELEDEDRPGYSM